MEDRTRVLFDLMQRWIFMFYIFYQAVEVDALVRDRVCVLSGQPVPGESISIIMMMLVLVYVCAVCS